MDHNGEVLSVFIVTTWGLTGTPIEFGFSKWSFHLLSRGWNLILSWSWSFFGVTYKRAFLWQLIIYTLLSWNCSLYGRTSSIRHPLVCPHYLFVPTAAPNWFGSIDCFVLLSSCHFSIKSIWKLLKSYLILHKCDRMLNTQRKGNLKKKHFTLRKSEKIVKSGNHFHKRQLAHFWTF